MHSKAFGLAVRRRGRCSRRRPGAATYPAVRSLLSALFLSCALALAARAADWPGVPFTEVRAYAWSLELNEEEVILPGMKVRPGALKNSGALLSADQTARLLAAQKRKVMDRPKAACYVPHDAFVFYNAEHQPVAFMEICFDCLGDRSGPALQADGDPDFIALAKIFSELKLPFGRFKTFAEFRRNTAPIVGQ